MIKRTTYATLLALAIGALFPGAALAGPEWCDSGSPPPNDFRFRPTGAPSAGSSTSWLNSTTSGVIDLATGTNTLVGGVAHGMAEAIAHAGVKVP